MFFVIVMMWHHLWFHSLFWLTSRHYYYFSGKLASIFVGLIDSKSITKWALFGSDVKFIKWWSHEYNDGHSNISGSRHFRFIWAQLLLLIAHSNWSYHRKRGYLQHSAFEICSRHATRYTDHLEAAEIVAFA